MRSVTVDIPGGGREIDVKKYAKVSRMQIQNAAFMVVFLTSTGSCLWYFLGVPASQAEDVNALSRDLRRTCSPGVCAAVAG